MKKRNNLDNVVTTMDVTLNGRLRQLPTGQPTLHRPPPHRLPTKQMIPRSKTINQLLQILWPVNGTRKIDF